MSEDTDMPPVNPWANHSFSYPPPPPPSRNTLQYVTHHPLQVGPVTAVVSQVSVEHGSQARPESDAKGKKRQHQEFVQGSSRDEGQTSATKRRGTDEASFIVPDEETAKRHFVPGPDREAHEELGLERESKEVANRRLEALEAQLAVAMKEKIESEEKRRMEEEHGMEEEEEQGMEEEDEVAEALAEEKELRAAEARDAAKTLASKTNEIATLLNRPGPPPQGRCIDAPDGPFPEHPPNRIPQFITPQVQKKRIYDVIKETRSARIPAVRLAPAPGVGGGAGEGATGGASDPGSSLGNHPCIGLVHGIVEEVLKRLGLDSLESARKGNRSSQLKRGLSAMTIGRREQQAAMSKEDDILWKRALREIWRRTYQVKSIEEFSSYISADSGKVARCNSGECPPAPDDWDLDFGPGFKSSLWNRRVMGNLLAAIKAARAQQAGWGVPDVTDEYITAQLYDRLNHSQQAWKKWQPRLIEATLAAETEEQIFERVDAARAKTQKRGTKNTSKSTMKYEEKADDVETWEFLDKMINYLGKNGMSSEEEVVRNFDGLVQSVYIVKLCSWREPKIEEYLDLVDNTRKALRTGRGAPGAARIREAKLGSSPPPTNMPRSMYHPRWLAGMEEKRPVYVEEYLQISKEVFEILDIVTEEMQMESDDESV
ncbi:hypothetical protein B0H15DRAFT_804046 [Mycena belliarum]|uniref:Uncharacterized protein n=1 Tax=Mycena belliarum TaxID=1033014 RepID=A0AAD6TWE3_9AGAR|nr:hypothetical protein B0H15DRAFT_804046 [Mycena belliae]